MTFLEIIATVIGGFAAAIYVSSYQCKKRTQILLLGALSRVLFITQYILLGAFAGAALDLIALFAAVIAQRKELPVIKKLLLPIIALIHVAILVASVLLYGAWYDIFVLLATTFCVAALWFSRERIIRAVSLCGSPCWLVYNLSTKAYFSAVSDVLAILSLLVAIWRYDLKRKKAE